MTIYRIKAYTKAKDGDLDVIITRIGGVRNYAIKMMSKYYKLYKNTLSAYQLSTHIAKKKKRICRTARMVKDLDAQSVQECIGRVYKGYQNFFSYCKKRKNGKVSIRVRPPKKRKARHNKSFTLLQCGYKFNPEWTKLRVLGKWYGFHKSQDIKGKVKRITIKRDSCGDIWFVVLTDWKETMEFPRTGKAAGFDFGLKTFLVRHDGNHIEAPEFFKWNRRRLAKLQRAFARKKKGSKATREARVSVAKFQRHIENQRNDWQWKTAIKMFSEFDVICIEDLNMKGMQMHPNWGRKVSDYAYASFVSKLEHIANKSGKVLVKVNRWSATSQKCSNCGYKNQAVKDKKVREWVCPQCGAVHDRDVNAAKNILMEGTSSIGLDIVRLLPTGEAYVA